jgi:hypothetical protein
MDMERILKPRANAPDVIKSALDKKDTKINTRTIDNLFGAPEKINIPERYIPESVRSNVMIKSDKHIKISRYFKDNITPEERQVRLKKADSIRKMLADTTSTGDSAGSRRDNIRDAMTKEKKEREHLLALNQVIARQVIEKSRQVAG